MWPFTKSPRYLPKPEGKFVTGCTDVMLNYSEDGLFMRLYYPSKASQQEETQWIPWLQDNAYLEGMAKAIYVKPILLQFLKWYSRGDTTYLPTRYGEKVNTDNKLKCIILSHGYASSRFLISVVCNELASRGYLIAAIEHKDRSAGYTYYYKNKEDVQNDKKTPINVKHIKLGAGHYEGRNSQVQIRADECCKLLDFLIGLNNGEVPYNVLDDLNKNFNFNLADLVGKLDLDSFTMAGHSFGGATTLLAMSRRHEFKQGILLDPWMFPIKQEIIVEKVTQPLLFINTQTFQISTNITAMEKFLTNDQTEIYTLMSTTHENQTDTVLVFGYWLNWFMRKLDPHLALKLNNALILRFLKQHTHDPGNIDDVEMFLDAEKVNVVAGLPKPWA